MKKFINAVIEISWQTMAWAFFGVIQIIFYAEIDHPASFLLLLSGWCCIMWAIAREKNLS